MEIEENIPEYKLKLHKAKVGYVAELYIKEKEDQNIKSNNIELIMIVDRSGSMGQSYTKIFQKVMPLLLEKIHYPQDKKVHFITFDSIIEYRKIDKNGFLNPLKENARGCTYMHGVFEQLDKIITNQNSSYRILTLSDGDLHDSPQTSNTASEYYNKIKGKYNINSQAIRFFSSSYANPDTLGLASVIQLNTVKQATLLDVNAKDDESTIADQLSKLFIYDGLGNKILLLSDKQNIQTAPWEEKKNQIVLAPGRNIFWLDDISQFNIKFNEEEPVKVNMVNDEDINTQNYGIILADKIKEFMTKLKILKILENSKAQEELEKMVKYFKEFEDSLERVNEEELVLKDGKMNSRIQYIKQLINKRKGLISNQMEAIKNEQKLSELNSQQKADYLRNVDNTKLGKSLAKRAVSSGLDFTEVIKNEIIEMKNHLAEINDIDYSNDPISFYSTSSTLESIITLCALVEDPVFNEMDVTQFLEITNIVGIASLGTIADYPDPLLYLAQSIYPGCYISVSDIITAESVSKNQSKLKAPGLNQEINNCIPVFSEKKVYDFLRKYAPTLLELSAGIGMRRVLADIPKTFEGNILSGLWKMIGIVKGNEKYEVNIKSLIELIKTMIIVAGNHNEDVIEVIQNQFKNENCKKLGLYLNGYGLFQLLPVLNKIATQNMLSKEELQKFMRAIYRFEVFKIIRKNIRKNENQKDYIEKTMNEALGIDFEKYGTKLPEMFEKKLNPEFCDTYVINKEEISKFKKQMGWIENIPYAYILFEAAQKQDPLNEIKNMPQFNLEKKKEYFGINYDFDKFLIFNIVQSLFYKEKIDRENENDKIMKIIDSNDEVEVDKFLKEQTKHIYSSKYNIENQKQIKLQNEMITKELVEKLKNAQNIEEFNDLMRKGITKGYLTHIIKDESTKGYNDLKNILLDEKIEVPLRFEKIRNIISATDEKGEILWNKGNAVRNKRIHYQKFIEKHIPDLWKQISEVNIIHKYREKENRQGHSNKKQSYWAIGFDTLDSFYKNNTKEAVDKYKGIHTNCCGLGKKEDSLKYEKKKIRKEKRKKYREEKKGKTEKKEEKEENDKKKLIGNKHYRRGGGRGRGRGRKK
jgi:hypothetical protein